MWATGEVAENPTKGTRRGGVTGGVEWETAVDESRKEMADWVESHQADQEVEHDHTTSATNWCNWFERCLPLSSLFVLFFSFLR